jgi:hypothetical protein
MDATESSLEKVDLNEFMYRDKVDVDSSGAGASAVSHLESKNAK